MREEWTLFEDPSFDPCMVRYSRLVGKPCNASEIAVPASCDPVWAHRVAALQNSCADVPQPTLACGANRACRADQFRTCIMKGWTPDACAALLREASHAAAPFVVADCEAAWTAPDRQFVVVDCVRWMAAFGCRDASTCVCVTVQRTENQGYTTHPCVIVPQSWPRIYLMNAVLLLCVTVCLW